MDVIARIQKVLQDQDIKTEAYTNPDTNFIADLNFDSLDAVELTLALEEEFNLDIPDGDMDKIDTVGKLYDYIKGRVKE